VSDSSGFGLRPVGDRAVLVELADNDAVQSLAAAVREQLSGELAEVVPGELTVVLVWRARRPPIHEVGLRLQQIALPPTHPSPLQRIVIPVRYDGPDLEHVAGLTGLDPGEVVGLHTAADYRVAFIGFAPGFAYLRGGDQRLAVPRRDTPRERVSAGSVAIAAGYSAVYPTDSPGGWQILGHTELTMFDPGRDPPVLLEPGARVSFEATR
jgi:KipI family sensor histidine kinase inhibitor